MNGGESGNMPSPMGKGQHGYDGPVNKHSPMHNFINLILRILTAIITLVAIIIMLKSTEHVLTPAGVVTARWRDFPAFKWFMVANAVVLTYSVLAAIVAGLSLCTKRSPLSSTATAALTYTVDLLLGCALLTAVVAALTVAWIGRKGQASTGWGKVCPLVDRFCDHIVGSIVSGLLGFIFLLLTTFVDVSALHRLGSHRH